MDQMDLPTPPKMEKDGGVNLGKDNVIHRQDSNHMYVNDIQGLQTKPAKKRKITKEEKFSNKINDILNNPK